MGRCESSFSTALIVLLRVCPFMVTLFPFSPLVRVSLCFSEVNSSTVSLSFAANT